MNELNMVLQCQGLHKRFTEGSGASQLDVSVLRGVDLSVARGETLAIVGASGSGKSTLLHLLGGLDAPTQGRVKLAGRDWPGMSPGEQGRWRNLHLGFVYQFHHLLPEFSALDNVAMPLRIRRLPVAEERSRAAEILSRVGLAERLSHLPGELSGGERQRCAVARALVTQPAGVRGDEPTGNLDEQSGAGILESLCELNRTDGLSIVLVTHDPSIARRADRIVRLAAGRVEEV